LSLTIIAGRPPGDRVVDDQRERLVRAVVHDCQNPEPPSPGQHVGDEVERPALVRPCGIGARAGGPLAATSNRQRFLTVEPVQLRVV
jgi:hypothetical protein